MAPQQPQQRLKGILNALSPPTRVVETLKVADITYDIPAALTPSRLPRASELLDVHDEHVKRDLHFLLQKYVLGQDIFLVSQPGPYARRLAMTFASMINAEYEYIALHRDVGETELKQGREIGEGGSLVYVDSAAVWAVKAGRLLILEGIEKAERGIMPVLNNLLENREMNLDDGTHIVHPHRHAQMHAANANQLTRDDVFIPAAPNFRVIAIAAPVPPYPGYPLDPPFRSRFQARFVDPIGSSLALAKTISGGTGSPSSIPEKVRKIILTTQYSSETRNAIEAVSKFDVPPFPQTALLKLRRLVSMFPPPERLTPGQLARLFLTLHPKLSHAPLQAWGILSRQTEAAGLGELGSPSMVEPNDQVGLLGYRASSIERQSQGNANITFAGPSGLSPVTLSVAAGPKSFRPFPFKSKLEFHATPRFMGLFTSVLQAHALGWDVSFIPPPLLSTASSSTSTLVNLFGQVLGYETETVHLYKEIGGRELIMRRKIGQGGVTTWEPSPLVEGAWSGRLVHLAGLDVVGSTAGSLARLVQDREVELWTSKRIVAEASESELASGELSVAHPSFRIISTSSKSSALKDWLSDEHANMFFPIPCDAMSVEEETALLSETRCPPTAIHTLLSFADSYRKSVSVDSMQKNRKLGTRTLLRIARKVALHPQDADLRTLIGQALLSEFLPAAERMNLDALLREAAVLKRLPAFNPAPLVHDNTLIFPPASDQDEKSKPTHIARFDASQDPDGAASHVPYMDHFYDNSLQTRLMRDLAVDLELLGEHVVLLGNQGVGKNKIVDRLCQLLGRPREYIQLHRDTTVNQLMFTTSLEGGIIKYAASPLLRAITHGRVIIIDEADKAPEHVVAIFRGLAGHSEMTLSDGRRVRPMREREGDIAVHPNFRLILLANRPGYPFLGNHFLQVLGDNFSCHSVSNPDQESERRLLAQLAPELDSDLIRRLVAAFQDLRKGYDSGDLGYPYSLRELINLVRHVRAYPNDTLSNALRNVFDFDIYKPETMDKLAEILDRHGLSAGPLGLDAAREAAKREALEIRFEPTGNTDLSEPKEGKHDPDNDEHVGGNTWAGGSGGRDTAGLGGRGGYKRLWRGHKIKQVSDELKDAVPDDIKKKAQELAREELNRRLQELNMSPGDAEAYGALLTAVQAHIASLLDLLEHLAAREEERVWVKWQTDGELDDSRLTEGLTGETTVYKRRGTEKPEMGRPQMKPKRIRFVFDISGSMYRFQYDGRLQRCLETAVMLMETFDRLSRKEKYVWDMYGHSGDSPLIPLVEAYDPPTELQQRWKIAQKMAMVTQYAFAGDFTVLVEAIEKGIVDVAKCDADDWCVIAITDANFERYGITEEHLKHAMNISPKVHTALICIGDGADVSWITKSLPGRGFRVENTADIPMVLRSILANMVDRNTYI